MKKSKYFEWNAWYETIQNKLRSYWFHSSQHTDTVKVISILSPIAFNDLCKQFRHYKNHIFFPQLDRGMWRAREKKICPHRIVSFQFDNSQEVAESHTSFHSTIRRKNVEMFVSCHTVSLCLSHAHVNERVYQSMRECDVFVCCIGVNVIVGECWLALLI